MKKSILYYWLSGNNCNLSNIIPIIFGVILICASIIFFLKEKDKKEKVKSILMLAFSILYTIIFLNMFINAPSYNDRQTLISRFKGTEVNSRLQSIEFFPPFEKSYHFIGDKEINITKFEMQKIILALSGIEYTSVKAPITYNCFRVIFIYNDGKKYEFYCTFSKDAGTILKGDYGEFRCDIFEKVLIELGIPTYMKGWYPYSRESETSDIYEKIILKQRNPIEEHQVP